MKNAKKYVKLYEEKADACFQKWGYYYPPRTWEEFHDWENQTFEKYLKEKEDHILKTKLYISLLNTTDEFGFYIAFQQMDYQLLNDVIYQTSRHSLLNRGGLASGTDHCNMLMDATSAFSSNDFVIIDHFFPKNLPHSKGRYYTEVAVNLLKVLYYKEEELKAEALEKADKFLQKKISLWEKYVVLYFIALINNNREEVSSCLQELCLAYQKAGYPTNKLDKCFAAEIHGMYRFAKIINKELFDSISMPDHACFSKEFEAWQAENNYPKGQLFYKRPQAMDHINKIFEATLPTVELEVVNYPSGNKIYKNVDKFTRDLAENVMQVL